MHWEKWSSKELWRGRGTVCGCNYARYIICTLFTATIIVAQASSEPGFIKPRERREDCFFWGGGIPKDQMAMELEKYAG